MANRRVLVIGVGSIGERHVRCFLQTGRADVGICELDSERLARVADSYPLWRTHAALDDALAAGYELAVICTPAHLHVPQALQLAEAGVHLFIEKPLSTSLDQVDLLLETVQRRELVAGVAYVTRCNPILADMKAALDSGSFGRPVQLVAVTGQHFPTYRPAYREIYYRRHETGGGAIQDALTHLINSGQWLVGPPQRLVADAEHLVLPGVEVEDTVHVLARQGPVLACYALNQHQAPNELTLTVICERGTARFESHQGRWLRMSEPGAQWEVAFTRQLERDDVFVLQAHSILDALESGSAPRCSLAEALQTLRVNLAILQSVRSGAWESV